MQMYSVAKYFYSYRALSFHELIQWMIKKSVLHFFPSASTSSPPPITTPARKKALLT